MSNSYDLADVRVETEEQQEIVAVTVEEGRAERSTNRKQSLDMLDEM
jgi:hypothetical protein